MTYIRERQKQQRQRLENHCHDKVRCRIRLDGP